MFLSFCWWRCRFCSYKTWSFDYHRFMRSFRFSFHRATTRHISFDDRRFPNPGIEEPDPLLKTRDPKLQAPDQDQAKGRGISTLGWPQMAAVVGVKLLIPPVVVVGESVKSWRAVRWWCCSTICRPQCIAYLTTYKTTHKSAKSQPDIGDFRRHPHFTFPSIQISKGSCKIICFTKSQPELMGHKKNRTL